MLVLQSNTDSLHILPGSSGESHATSSDGVCNFSNIKVEEGTDIIDEGFIAMNEEVDISIKKEEIPDIKSEPDEVRCVCLCVCVCVSRHILPVSGNVNCFCAVSISGHLKQLQFWE